MIGRNGRVRSHWQYLVRGLDGMGSDGLSGRIAEARRLIRDNDVTYHIYADPHGMGRPWDLDIIPLLISSKEWSRIETGLMQRAELLNLVLADIYGPRTIIKNGVLPPELLYANPGFLRPCAAADFDSRLHLYAADLARTQDGTVQVINDRTQAPSGVGYALENRIVMARIFPSLFRDSHVHRLSGFLRTVRLSLMNLAAKPGSDPRMVLLSPGSGNESYFEHAYLSNYLGITLVQGTDLTVRDNRLWLRTLDGLLPVDVVLRRVNDDYCDPLELREDSYLGVPGLLQVVRDRNVVIANTLGSGVLQNPGLMAYMPKLAKHFLGHDLALANTQTWWCGESSHLDHVLKHFDNLVLKPFDFRGTHQSVFCSALNETQRQQWKDAIQRVPHRFAAQEKAGLSTTPVLAANHELTARHAVIRSYLVTRGDSFMVMPGGLTRVAGSEQSMIVSNQFGGASKDTWILASEPEKLESLTVAAMPATLESRPASDIPSRVADNFYWLGRYAERAESLVRLLRVIQDFLSDPMAVAGIGESGYCLSRLLEAVTFQTTTFPGFVGADGDAKRRAPEQELMTIVVDAERNGSLMQTLNAMLRAARSIRDRLSTYTLRVINDIDVQLQSLRAWGADNLGNAYDELDNLIVSLLALSGLMRENMSHEQGWRFMETGRRLERAINTSTFLRATLTGKTRAINESILLEAILSVNDSLLTYKRKFPAQLQAAGIIDLIVRYELNPRSIAHQLADIQVQLSHLPMDRTHGELSNEERLIMEALTQLRIAQSEPLAEINDGQRHALAQLLMHLGIQLPALSNQLAQTYFYKELPLHQLVPIHPESRR